MLSEQERVRVDSAIKHFQGLQKRYTAQHNGTRCEHVRLALIGLKRLSEQPEVVHADDGGCDGCEYENVAQGYEPCSECSRIHSTDHYKRAKMDGQRAGEEQNGRSV